MGLYPFNPNLAQEILTSFEGVIANREYLVHFQVSAANATTADTSGILADVTDTGIEQVITTGITQPGVPRNITATAGGTATDIKAVQVVISGTNYDDEEITETLPAFTVNTAGTVEGSKAFKTLTKITIPAHDGTGAKTSIGFGENLGLPFKLERNSLLYKHTYLNNIVESTEPAVTVSTAAVESNIIKLNSTLNGKQVDADMIIDREYNHILSEVEATITGMLNQTANWKHVTSQDEYGEPTFVDSVIKVRWESKQRVSRNKHGEEVISEARAFCLEAVQSGDVLEYQDQEWPVTSVCEAIDQDGNILYREVSVCGSCRQEITLIPW